METELHNEKFVLLSKTRSSNVKFDFETAA